MAFARRVTLADAVTSVMKVIGLVPPTVIVGGNNRTADQLVELATQVGQQLCDEAEWQVLMRVMEINTVVGQTDYPLPDDFSGFYSDAQWNYTTRLPALGNLSEPEWQMLKARNLGGTTIASMFQISGDNVVLYYVPADSQNIKMPYKSRAWVLQSDGTTYSDQAVNEDDSILFDPQLFKVALRRMFYIVKGIDAPATEREYQSVLNRAKAKDTPGRTLSLQNRPEYPYIGVLNLPDTGYGS